MDTTELRRHMDGEPAATGSPRWCSWALTVVRSVPSLLDALDAAENERDEWQGQAHENVRRAEAAEKALKEEREACDLAIGGLRCPGAFTNNAESHWWERGRMDAHDAIRRPPSIAATEETSGQEAMTHALYDPPLREPAPSASEAAREDGEMRNKPGDMRDRPQGVAALRVELERSREVAANENLREAQAEALVEKRADVEYRRAVEYDERQDALRAELANEQKVNGELLSQIADATDREREARAGRDEAEKNDTNNCPDCGVSVVEGLRDELSNYGAREAQAVASLAAALGRERVMQQKGALMVKACENLAMATPDRVLRSVTLDAVKAFRAALSAAPGLEAGGKWLTEKERKQVVDMLHDLFAPTSAGKGEAGWVEHYWHPATYEKVKERARIVVALLSPGGGT